MKSPISGKEMKLKTQKSILNFRKEGFEYRHQSFFCEESGEHFTTTELDELNLNQVYFKYRDKYNIPFPDEIKNLKEKYDLSSSKMSLILGLGPNSYRNYEKGEMPSRANANLIQTVLDDHSAFKKLVEFNPEINISEKTTILNKIDSLINIEKTETHDHRFIAHLFESNSPDALCGYVRPRFEKFIEMIVYFSENLTPVKTTMNKLLWYADFLNYKSSAQSISGCRYMAHVHGPVPIRYDSLFDYVVTKDYVELNFEEYGNGFYGERFQSKPSKQFNRDYFSDSEIIILHKVATTFKECNARQIRKLSHEELGWIENEKDKSIIDYDYSFDLIHI